MASLECIKPYFLVGGTALALQLNTRQSEDLGFMNWKLQKAQKPEVDWVAIEKELKTIGIIESRDIWDFNHVEFVVSGVKISFYTSGKSSPVTAPVHLKDNLKLADVEAIGAMKMEVMLRRSNFRDYYDIYAILQHGVNFRKLIDLSLSYSGHILTTKNLLAILTDSSRFNIDSGFEQLNPKYKVTPADIEAYLKTTIKAHF
ncbi:MAG: nucleotidyl transferase AbiEii/AbiGii toxin family protein [Bacteroidota bacterium]|nr:nucleotidyl transferase AbiEii/AbiGii toxin family protein [Bacteroidota bacterium]